MPTSALTFTSSWNLASNGCDGRTCIVTIPLRTRSEANMREVWQARHRRRKAQRQTVGLVVAGVLAVERVGAPCCVYLTRCAPSGGLDGDNLQGALKAVRDGVADAMSIDDGDPRVRWQYDQRRSPRGVWSVEIQIVTGG